MKLLPILLVSLVFAGCKDGAKSAAGSGSPSPGADRPATQAAGKAFDAVPMQGYFVKNTVAIDGDSKTVVLGSKAEFDKYFGVAKTMDNTVTPVDFSKSRVVAIFTKPSEAETKIVLTKTERDAGTLTVHYKVETGAKRGFATTALVLFPIPNDIETVVVEGNGTKETIRK